MSDHNRLPADVKPFSESGLIAAAALNRDVEVDYLGRGNIRLRHGRRSYRFRRGWSTFQPRLAQRCTAQKEVTSRLLRARGLAAPENIVFDEAARSLAWAWAKHQLPVVVKPHDGQKGKQVHVGLAARREFLRAFDAVCRSRGSALVERMVPGVEHRFAIVGGKVLAVARRVPMNVVGDGRSTIAGLIEAKNEERRRRNTPIHKLLRVDNAVLEQLGRLRMSLETRPSPGQVVFLRATSNVSAGGDAIDVTEEITQEQREFAEEAAAAIPGLRYAGLDVLIDRDGCYALEVNCGPMFSMHRFPWEGTARDLWSPVLDLMFPAAAAGSRGGPQS